MGRFLLAYQSLRESTICFLMTLKKLLNTQLPTLVRHWRVFLWSFVVAACLLETVALLRIPSVANAAELATTHQPERITEVYIGNYSELQKTFTTGRPVKFSFVVHNLEGRDENYHYAVAVNGIQTSTASVSVPNGQTQTINASFAINDSSTTKAEVEVTLIDQHQSIHFWTERTP